MAAHFALARVAARLQEWVSFREEAISTTQQVLAGGPQVSIKRSRRPPERRHLRGSDLKWAIAFVAPYAAVFFAFVVYPFGYALWIAGRPSLSAELMADPLYLTTVVNTLLFVGLAVNVKMFVALLLSGFFLRRGWWVQALLAVFILPWAVAAAQAAVSFHWMLVGRWGLVDEVLSALFGIEGPEWLDHRWLALGSNIVAYIWKWLPFWTVIFLAARITIPREIYDAAEVDGATGSRRFVHVTLPLLANLYLICTLLSTLWAIGDFTTVYLVSSGGPALSTEVLATLGYHYAFDIGNPALGVAAVMSALPVLIPIMIVLMRRLQTSEVL
jgi:multiple sugar transport system permease protein